MVEKELPRDVPGQLKVRSFIVAVILFLVFDLLATRAIRTSLLKLAQKQPSVLESNIKRIEQRTSDSEQRLRILTSELAAQRTELAQGRLAQGETCTELRKEIARLKAEHSRRKSPP